MCSVSSNCVTVERSPHQIAPRTPLVILLLPNNVVIMSGDATIYSVTSQPSRRRENIRIFLCCLEYITPKCQGLRKNIVNKCNRCVLCNDIFSKTLLFSIKDVANMLLSGCMMQLRSRLSRCCVTSPTSEKTPLSTIHLFM